VLRKKKLKKLKKRGNFEPSIPTPSSQSDPEEKEQTIPSDDETPPEPQSAPVQKKKRRRAQKNQEADQPRTPEKKETNSGETKDVQSDLKCGKCGNVFKTRNMLFNHIKKTGHALAK